MHPEQQGLMQGGGYGQGAGGYQNDGRGYAGDGGYGRGGYAGDGGGGGYGGNPTGGRGYGPTDQGAYGGGGGYEYGGNPTRGGYAPTDQGGYAGGGGGGFEQGNPQMQGPQMQGNPQWKRVWCAAAFLMMVMAVFGLIETIGSGQIIDAIEFFYLFIFSLIVTMDNFPFMKPLLTSWKSSIGIYIFALRRMTFLGLFLIYIGSALIGAFCNNDTGGFLTTLGGVAGGIGVLVGLLSLFFGVRNSMALERLRVQFEEDAQYGSLNQAFSAAANGKEYLNPNEFLKLCEKKGVLWDSHYNMLIFGALSYDPYLTTLSREAFMNWVTRVDPEEYKRNPQAPPSQKSCLPTLL